MQGNVVGTAVLQVIPSLKGGKKAIEKELGGSMGGAGADSGKAYSKGFTKSLKSGIGKAIKGGIFTLGAGGLATAGTALNLGFKRLDNIDKAKAKLSGLGHTGKDIDKIMASANEAVTGTAFGLDEAATASAGAVAAGIPKGKGLTDYLTLVADSATIAGTDLTEMGSIWNKVAASDRLDMDVVNQLQDRGIPILQALSDESGKSIDQVRKDISDGKVDLDSFSGAMEETLGGAAQESGKTFSGAMANMKAALGRLGASFLSPIFKSGPAVFGRIGSALDKLGPFAERAGGAVKRAFGAIGDIGKTGLSEITGSIKAFSASWRFFDGDVTSSGLPGFMERLAFVARTAFEALLPHVKQFGSDMKALWPTVKSLGKSVWDFLVAAFKAALPYLKTAAVVIGVALVAAMKVLPPILKGIMTALGWVLDKVKPLLPLIASLAAMFAVYMGIMKLAFLINKFRKAQVLLTATTKIMTGAQKALNFVMRMNPIGIIISIIMVLVGTLIYLYKNNETVRKAFDGAWKKIKSAISAVVNWFTKTAWPAMKKAFKAIKTWVGRIPGWFTSAKNGLKKAWAKVKEFVMRPIRASVNWIKKKIVQIYNGFLNIRDRTKRGWARIKEMVMRPIRIAVDWIKRKVVQVFEKFISVRDRLKRGWAKINEMVRAPIRSGVDWIKDKVNQLKKTFRNLKDGIGRVWDKVLGKVKSPMKSAIRWINRHFIGKINGMLGSVGIGKKTFRVPKISTAGWATGGYTGAGGKYTPAGIVHKDEFVIKKEATNRLRKTIGLEGLNYMNQTGRMPEMGGYANGGIVALGKRIQRMGYDVSEHPAFGGVVPGAHSATGWHYKAGALDINADSWNSTAHSKYGGEMNALDRLNRILRGDGWNTIWRAANHWDHLHVDIGNGQSGGGGWDWPDWVKNTAGWVKDKFKGITDKFSPSNYGPWGHLAKSSFGHVQDAIKGKIKDKATSWKDKLTGWFSGGDKESGSKSVREAVRGVAKGYGWGSGAQWDALNYIIQRESSWNPNAANPTSSARGLFQKMTNIHGPVEGTAAGQAGWGLKYIRERYGSPIGARAFWERNHWYADGGLVKPMLFDSGGYLPEGISLVENRTGKPEPLKRMDTAGGHGDITVYVQSPWGDGKYMETKIKDVVASEGSYDATLRRQHG